MGRMMDEQDFRKKCDAALESLRKRLLELGDEHDFEVEGTGEKLELIFEGPEEARIDRPKTGRSERVVISQNTAARQIWISALATSFKLSWSEAAGSFILEKTGETLPQVMSRILSEQLRASVSV